LGNLGAGEAPSNFTSSGIILVLSWDEQQLTAKPSQIQHSIGPVAAAPVTPTPIALLP